MVRQQEGSHQGRHGGLPLHSRLSPSDDYLINQLIFISGRATATGRPLATLVIIQQHSHGSARYEIVPQYPGSVPGTL